MLVGCRWGVDGYLVGCWLGVGGKETVWRRLNNAVVVSAEGTRTGRDVATNGVTTVNGDYFWKIRNGLFRSKRLNDV